MTRVDVSVNVLQGSEVHWLDPLVSALQRVGFDHMIWSWQVIAMLIRNVLMTT